MKAPDVARAVDAVTDIVSALGLAVADARVLHSSNKLAVRLLPCDVFARVAFAGREGFQAEVQVGRRLAKAGSPVARLEPSVDPRVYERDGFAVTLWTYYERWHQRISPADYAGALERLHAGMAQISVAVPHFTDRVAEAQQLVVSRDRTPGLEDSDRDLLGSTLLSRSRAIHERCSEQLLHGEPHPGNVLNTADGPLFIDLETCCRGPIEFDLAHLPEDARKCYSGADQNLLRDCHLLVLAMIAAWRWDTDDQFPDRDYWRVENLNQLRAALDRYGSMT